MPQFNPGNYEGRDRLAHIEDYIQNKLDTAQRNQLSLQAQALVASSGDALAFASLQSPSTQTAYGVLLGLRAGDTVTGVGLRLGVAASGTAPTTARFGIADSTGKILAISSNLNSGTGWSATGAAAFPLAAPFSITADGGYYACFCVNGTWGTTQPTILRGANQAAAMTPAFAGGVVPNFKWAGQTDLPAVGSSLTLTAALDIGWWMALY